MEYLFLIVILLVVALFLLQYFVFSRRHKVFAAQDREFFKKNWDRILNSDDLRYKVMEADKLLEYFMRKFGWHGSFGDMLKQNGNRFSDLNALWKAHKLRNVIAHELNFSVKEKDVKYALKAFRAAFKDLGL